jgi:hypothetical protein
MPIGGRDTPARVTLPYKAFTKTVIDGYPIYTFYIGGDTFLTLPLDANVRLPSAKSLPYKDMVDTLKNFPRDFFLQNGGINVIASNVEVIETRHEVKLTFNPGTGIVNGGHTQLAILDTRNIICLPDVTIKVEVIQHDFSLDKLAQIAASKNTASNVKEYSIAEKKGLFIPIKRLMKEEYEKHIIWYENREVPNGKGITGIDLISLINLFNAKEYQGCFNRHTKQPNKSATSKTSVFNDWINDPSKHDLFYPLVNDIIELQEHILSTFHESSTRGLTNLNIITKNNPPKQSIFDGKDLKWDLPKQFLLPWLASFRADIYYDEANHEIGWHEDPKALFDRTAEKLSDILKQTYKSTYHSEINRASKDSNLWQILYVTIDQSIDKSSHWKAYHV